MVIALTAAVGTKQPNRLNDVKAVQGLLNQCLNLLIPLRPLAEDGLYGLPVETAVRLFQRRVIKILAPDGLVQPNSLTWSQLMTIGGKALPSNVNIFITNKIQVAKFVKNKWRIPISVLIAQAALETGWGTSVVNNAYFGIKGRSSASGASTTFATTEYINGKKVSVTDTFRAYKDFADSADDYGRFLNQNNRYAKCFLFRDDPIKFSAQVALAGYATDPLYANKISSIILSNGLLRYDA